MSPPPPPQKKKKTLACVACLCFIVEVYLATQASLQALAGRPFGYSTSTSTSTLNLVGKVVRHHTNYLQTWSRD